MERGKITADTSTHTAKSAGVPAPVRDPRIARVAIGDLLRRAAQRFRTAPVTRERGHSTSFAELDRAANRVANFLLDQGFQYGDRVLTIADNSTEYLAVIFGIFKAGLVWVPVNTMLSADDMAWIAAHCTVRGAWIDDAVRARLADCAGLDAALRANGVELWPMGQALAGASPHASPVTKICPEYSNEEPDVAIAGDDLALIMYTSGTTARPKGVMHNHQAVMFATLNNAVEDGPTRDDVGAMLLPLFHCAQFSLCLTYLVTGARQVVMNGFDPGRFLADLQSEGVTHMLALPMMYAALLNHPDRPTRSSLRYCLYAMAPLPRPLLERLIAEFCPNFALSSGQTEIFPRTTTFRPAEQLNHNGNVWGDGCPLDDMAILDDAGKILPDGEIGEICHRGPNAMIGYYADQEATDAVSEFGWHHTGDIGTIRNGQLHFLDRKKDIIKSGGENVSSMRVEEVLLGHPAVANAAAVGLPHPRWTEAVTVFALLRPGVTASEADILAHCRAHLSGFETPKRIVFLEALPMTATGKIKKAELRVAHTGLYADASATAH